jgi:drug/metabolite transporter (DMT)-like permease
MATHKKAYGALAFICLVWGTTYLAIRVGVVHYPAFLFAGIRQTLAGLILCLGAWFFNRRSDFSRTNVLRQMLIGFLMLTLGNGCVTWGEKYIPSGVAALICSMMPIFAVILNFFFHKSEKLNLLTALGMLMGTLGVALIFRNDLAALSDPAYLAGMCAVMVATASWAMGSLLNKKHHAPVNPFLNSGMQLFFGGVFMLCISPLADDYRHVQWVNTQGLLALGYLIIFGSVLSYAAYMYSLSQLPVGVATIYSYINPLVAVLLGYVALHEPLNIYTALSFVAIILAVLLVNTGYRRQHKPDPNPVPVPIPVTNEPDAFPENFPIES